MYRQYFRLPQQLLKTVLPSSQPSTFLNVNNENHTPKRWAGHSKWQNVKSTKEANAKQKSIAFQRLFTEIVFHTKQGGPDISRNYKLKSVLDEAKKMNMPKTTIDRAIKAGQGQATGKPFWTVFSGPRGIVLGLEVIFANNNKGFLQSTLSPFAKKLNMKFEPHFSHLCDEKGLIITDPPEGAEGGYEKALEDAIEIGLDEVHERDDKCIIFECLPDRVDSYAQMISKKGYKIQSVTRELDFKEFVDFKNEEVEEIEKLISTIQSKHDEVIRGSYNISQQ